MNANKKMYVLKIVKSSRGRKVGSTRGQGCQIFLGTGKIYSMYGLQIHISYGRKIDKMAYIEQHLAWQGPPKLTQIVFFWFENMPSGNPGRG
jgi:hypothetical protein